jgi:outer membrane receptor protein involved in Fe transport
MVTSSKSIPAIKIVASLLAGAAPVTGWAQAAPPAETPAANENGLQDIVVTAQRRSQSLSDVGVSVSTVSGNDLTVRGMTSASDLFKAVPGFTAADSSLNVPVYSLRGVGLNDSSLASNSTVAVSVDEVPLPYTAMTSGAILDLQRIEVLKGPQGTLYGQNSTGGAINYIANKPSQKQEAGLQVGFGRFNTFTAEGYVSGPLSNNLTVRLAGNTTQAGPWQRSYTRNDTLGSVHRAAGRLTLEWKPTDTLTIDILANGWVDKSDSLAFQATAFRAQSPANIGRLPQVFGAPLAPADARAADWAPGNNYARNDRFYQLGAKIEWDVFDGVKLSSISAYSQYNADAYIDRDGIVARNFQTPVLGHIKSRYTELRLSKDTSKVQWSFGGNYRNDDIFDFQRNDITEATNAVAQNLPNYFADVRASQKVETYALFADGEYRFTPQISAVGGVRYTVDKRDFHGCSADPGTGILVPVYRNISNTFRTRAGLPLLPASAFQPGACLSLNAQFEPGEAVGRLKEDNVSFHGGINFKPAPGYLLYASFARGYKSGSFPTLGAAFQVGYEPAKQEKLDAWEVGFKTTMFDHTLRLNGAAFYYDYENKQLRGRILDAVFGSLSKFINIPKSRVYGAELEGAWMPVRGLTINGAVSYIKTEVLDFIGIDLFSQTVNFKGQSLNYTPKWSANLGADYRWEMGSKTLFAGGDLVYRSRTSGFLGNDPDLNIDPYTTLDLRAGVEWANSAWRFTVWGNNVTNKYYWNSVNRGSDTIIRAAAKPVTYGATLAFKY